MRFRKLILLSLLASGHPPRPARRSPRRRLLPPQCHHLGHRLGELSPWLFYTLMLFVLLISFAWPNLQIMALVEAAGLVVALSNNSCSRIRCNAFGRRCVRVLCGLFRSQEGVAWVVACVSCLTSLRKRSPKLTSPLLLDYSWLSFFLLIVVIWSWGTRKEDEEEQRPVEPVPPVQREGTITAEPEQTQLAQATTTAV
jgi:hypothetical protein